MTIDYNILNDDREQFRVLMQEVQAICRRNGAFQCRLDESLEQPGLFRLEYIVSTWAEHLRQNLRMTIDETNVFEKVWDLHVGETEPMIRHFLSTQAFMHLEGFGFSVGFCEYVENAQAEAQNGSSDYRRMMLERRPRRLAISRSRSRSDRNLLQRQFRKLRRPPDSDVSKSVWATQLLAPILQLSPPSRAAIYSFENLDWI